MEPLAVACFCALSICQGSDLLVIFGSGDCLYGGVLTACGATNSTLISKFNLAFDSPHNQVELRREISHKLGFPEEAWAGQNSITARGKRGSITFTVTAGARGASKLLLVLERPGALPLRTMTDLCGLIGGSTLLAFSDDDGRWDDIVVVETLVHLPVQKVRAKLAASSWRERHRLPSGEQFFRLDSNIWAMDVFISSLKSRPGTTDFSLIIRRGSILPQWPRHLRLRKQDPDNRGKSSGKLLGK